LADVYAIELNLSDVVDPYLREQLLAISTAFRISEAQQPALREAARQALAASAELRRLRSSVGQPR